MQINKKLLLPIIAILLFSLASQANAATITGAAYGQQIGFLHLDYTTAVNPCDPVAGTCPVTPTYNPDTYHFGLKDEFYISPADLNYGTMGASNPNSIAKIQDLDDCDKVNKICYLKGFMWSDTIGWTILDGSIVRGSGFGGDADKFPNSYYAKVNYDGIFSGYAWSEKTGWIKLSSDSFDPEAAVTALNYGVWIDLKASPVSPLSNPGCASLTKDKCLGSPSNSNICNWDETASSCASGQISLGRPLQGYAWSEKLGWIKFSPTTGDETFFGAYTAWLPDTTPPVINPLIKDNMWFVNTLDIYNIPWPNVATDPDTGINVAESVITVSVVGNPDNFTNCTGYGEGADDIFVEKSKTIDPNDKGININIAHIGYIQGTPHGFCAYTISGTVTNGAGLTSTITPKTFYVRAGDYVAAKSTFEVTKASAVADGNDFLSYTFTPKDVGSNPIVPVRVAEDALDDSGNLISADDTKWVRDVQGVYHFDADTLYFNTISFPLSNPSAFLPVKFDDAAVATTTNVYNITGNLSDMTFPDDGAFILRPVQNFSLQVASHAPTASCGSDCNDNNVILNSLNFTIKDRLPVDTTEVRITLGLDPIGHVSPPLVSSMDFTPAITIPSGEVSSDSLAPADPAFITFNVKNESKIGIDTVSIDNLFSLSNDSAADDAVGSQLFEFRDINTDPPFDGDSINLRTDYINLYTLKARYEILSELLGGDVNDTIFHTPTAENYPYLKYYYDLENYITPIGVNGSYEISQLSEEDPEASITIDRSDYVGNSGANSLVFAPKDDVTGGDSKKIKINFKIYDIYNETPTSDVTSSVSQYVGYRMPDENLPVKDFTDYALYELKGVIPDAELKRIGVQATGIVTGENVYETMTGREFQTITSPGLASLKKQMRDNAAELTRNVTACSASDGLTELSSSSSDCVKVDTLNRSVIAVYGLPGDTLVLDGSGDTINVPKDYRYTLIVRGGANVFIKDNIAYETGDTTGSFGMIVLADDKGVGGNVYISPAVTNIVGLLYAEGSLMSRTDGGSLYYLDSGTNTSDLKNQLYWQGSIVSKNTIGGAAGKTVPEGIKCETIDKTVCAQAYDLDYLRRFSVRASKDSEDNILGGYVSDGYKFSGGGTCNATPSCSYGGLPTTIKLTDDKNLIDLTLIPKKASKSLDPFFIEKDNRPAPLGFTTGAGMESTIEIR